MSDASPPNELPPTEPGPEPFLPENLPPVQPPSAGFILQLFVVPAIIVGAVIGIWMMFGQLASTDQDWQRQVDELKQSNPHRRWRGADSLVKMLEADSNQKTDGPRMADDRELATALVQQLSERLASSSNSEEEAKVETFLLMALGWMNVDEVVFPVLVTAMESQQDPETRFTALASAATIASRRERENQALERNELTDAILLHSTDPSADVRRIAAFALGFCAPEVSQDRLAVLLEDGDPSVRANAAMALAVQNSTLGLPVFEEILAEALETPDPLANLTGDDPEAEKSAHAREIDLTKKTANALKALEDLAAQLSKSEKDRLRPQLKTLGAEFRNVQIRSLALNALEDFDR